MKGKAWLAALFAPAGRPALGRIVLLLAALLGAAFGAPEALEVLEKSAL